MYEVSVVFVYLWDGEFEYVVLWFLKLVDDLEIVVSFVGWFRANVSFGVSLFLNVKCVYDDIVIGCGDVYVNVLVV